MSEPIRVLQVVPNMQAGGLETLIMNIYRNIDRSKIQFDFLVHYKGEYFYDNEIKALGGRIYNLSIRDDNNFLKYIKDLNSFFKNHPEYKIVHGHMVSTAMFYLFFAKKYGVPIRIIHSHNTKTNPGIKGIVKRMLASFSTMFANKYFACGKMAGNCLFRANKFEIINNGIEIERFRFNWEWRQEIRKEFGADDSTTIYGHVGRFNAQKNHDFLIDIFAEIQKKDDKCLFLLVGDGELRQEVFDKAINCGIIDKIRYLGVRDDVNKIYQAMDVFILPSLFEGFPVVATECQASGLPMIVSDTVSSEIKLVDNIVFLSLNQDKAIWAEKAIEKAHIKRQDTANLVIAAGFEIKDEAKRLLDLYLDFLR